MRLIDGDELAKKWTIASPEPYNTDAVEVLDSIREAPTVDAVVVTRCKNCEHYDMGVCLKIYSDGNVHPEAWQSRKPEDFCSYGERKDGGGSDVIVDCSASVCPSGGHHDYRMVAIGSDEVGDRVDTYRCSKCGEEFNVKFVT